MANDINITDLSVKAAAALTTADYLMTFTDDGNTTKTPAFEAISQANTENGCLCVKTAMLVIPTAQVLTLNSIPVAFGLTVPSGYYVQPTSIAASLDYNSIAYATNTRVAIRFIGAASGLSVFNNAFLSSASDAFFSVGHSSPTGTNVIVNTDIEAYVETGNPTAGNSGITIYLTYVLIEI